MPGGDRTGPYGVRARTGRGLGFCAGHEVPGRFNREPGRTGGSFGHCRGWRNRYFATGLPGRGYGRYDAIPPEPSAYDREDALREEAERLRAALADIERQLQSPGAS